MPGMTGMWTATSKPPPERLRIVLRILIAAAYFTAGVLHLLSPDGFVRIVPDWVPHPYQTVLLTGLCEIAGAIALFVPRLRRTAGSALALYALCVWPANFKHAIDGIAIGGTILGWWYHGPRLALQPAIIWWALFAGGLIDWPFGRRRAGAP
jgi:uncharacterized membrane protein